MKYRNITLSLLFAAATCIAAQAGAVVVYEFNSGGYVSGGQNLNTGTPFFHQKAFSDSVELSPTSGYTGPQFYGGYTGTGSLTSLSVLAPSVQNSGTLPGAFGNSGNDYIALTPTPTAASTAGEFAFLMMGQFASTTLSSMENITVTTNLNSESANYGRVAAVIRADGNYYISDQIENLGGLAQDTFDLSSYVHTTAWNDYDPTNFTLANGLPNRAGNGDATLLGTEVVDMTGVLVIRGVTDSNTFTSLRSLAIHELTLSAVPEPSSFVLLSLGISGLFLFRRYKKS